MNEERSEIAFFDVETTVPTRPGQGFAILEFGAILVCPKKLVELRHYSTLVRPADLSHISSLSVRCNGITKDAVVSAPTFLEIADTVYDILHGRIWAGHNILRFDCARIKEAFSQINRQAPEPKGTIDSLALLTQKFGRRAGDMKMASLATYFGLGQQTHRSLDDVRMNLEVLKYCATVLFLESSLPDVFTENSWISPNATTRSRSNGKGSIEQTEQNTSTPSSSVKGENFPASPASILTAEKHHPIVLFATPNSGELNLPPIELTPARVDSFDLGALRNQMENELFHNGNMVEEKTMLIPEKSPVVISSEDSNGHIEFLEPDNISISSISAILAPFYRGTQKIQILHRDQPLQLCGRGLQVRFGISTKFVDHAGRPRLNIMLDVPPNMCEILHAVNGLAQKLSVDSGSCSEWWPVLSDKRGFYKSNTIRLHLPTVAEGDTTRWATEIYQKDGSTTQKLVFSRFDIVELDSLFTPGDIGDAYFSLDAYDYHQNAGIRLVAKKLILHSS